MTSLNDAVLNTLNGAILYDRSILSQVSDEIFLISSWKNSSKISNQYQSGGRGETFIISNKGTNPVPPPTNNILPSLISKQFPYGPRTPM